MLVERDVRARFELQEAGHLAALAVLIEYLDRDLVEAGRLPFHRDRLYIGRAADCRGKPLGSAGDVVHGCSLARNANTPHMIAASGVVREYSIQPPTRRVERGGWLK